MPMRKTRETRETRKARQWLAGAALGAVALLAGGLPAAALCLTGEERLDGSGPQSVRAPDHCAVCQGSTAIASADRPAAAPALKPLVPLLQPGVARDWAGRRLPCPAEAAPDPTG